MLSGLLSAIIGTPGTRELRKLDSTVKAEVEHLKNAAESPDIKWQPTEKSPADPCETLMKLSCLRTEDKNLFIFFQNHGVPPPINGFLALWKIS